MKVIAVSRDRKFFRIGETFEQSNWYGVVEVERFIQDINKGDVVEIRSKKDDTGKNTLSFIKKAGAPTSGPTSFPPTEGPEGVVLQQPTEYSRPKTPEEREEIKRLAIGHMVSRTLIALQGQIDITNIESTIDSLFIKYTEKVS